MIDRENYCKDCKRSMWSEFPNNGRYVGSGEECHCKIKGEISVKSNK